ncbi:MAG: outer membrane protein assembly factor BamB family protein [Planctomycetota bacterium]|jgi:outer membrane protein assembly factor BamB
MRRSLLTLSAVLLGLAALGPAPLAFARQESPVYVDQSPRAWELYQRARDQARDNPGETVRLCQELLDEYPLRLLPIGDGQTDHLTSVRRRVLDMLRADKSLLDRYRIVTSTEAERLLETGALDQLARSRSLTKPGLTALLRLAQGDLEAARFHAARGRLAEALNHPDLTGRPRLHALFMLAVCAQYQGDTTGADLARASLRAAGADGGPFLDALDDLADAGEPPLIPRGMTALAPIPAADLVDLVGQTIWSSVLADSLFMQRFAAAGAGALPPGRASDPQRRRESDLLPALPTAVGDLVYINEGPTIRALDRFTGVEIWRRQFADRRPNTRLDPDIVPMDLSVITVRGDVLVTLTGHARPRWRTGDGRVVCLSAADGTIRWAQRLDRIGDVDEHEGLFPYGAPLVAEGRVYVLARKVSDQQLTSCYLVALRVEDGRPEWIRHVASSGAIRRTTRAFTSPVYHDGDIFVATNVGAVARIDATTGRTRWLRRYQVPIHFQDLATRGWEIASPVVTTRGLLALLQTGRRLRTILFDLETGDELESHDAATMERWASPRYLLTSSDMVYAVGREVRAFHVDDLRQPQWMYPSRRQSDAETRTERFTRAEIRGRAQATEDEVILPTVMGVLVLDNETGVERHRLDVAAPGNPLGTDSQLFLASADQLEAYMSFARAERMLRQRLAAAPGDPAPALSLVRLGMRVGRMDLVIEAGDLVLTAASRAPSIQIADESRSDLLDLLLDMADRDLAATAEEGESLYAMIGAAATTPGQRVRFLLAYADWLSDRSIDRAVERYQAILSDPVLATEPRRERSTVRPAADRAAARLSALITRRGRRIYAPQATFAERELELLRRTGSVEPARLQELAREFPFSDAAVDASLAAAQAHLARSDRPAALAALVATLRVCRDPAGAGRLLGQYVTIATELNRPASATAWVKRSLAAHGQLTLRLPEGNLDAATWLETAASAARPRQSTVGRFDGIPRKWSGRVLTVARGGPAPPDTALVLDGTQLMLVDGTLQPRWSVALDGHEPELLRFTENDILLWFGADMNDPRAVMLDAADGSERWTTARLADHLADPVRDLARNREPQQMPGGAVFDPRQTIALAGGNRMLAIQRTGGVVAFDLESDAAVTWSVTHSIDQVHLAILHETGLILAGVRWASTTDGRRDAVPAIVVLDPDRDGRERFSLRPYGRSGVRWMAASPAGELVYGTGEGLEAFDLQAGRKLWTNIASAAMDTRRGWSVEDHLVLEDRVNRLRAVALATGDLTDPFETPQQGNWEPRDLRNVLVDHDRIFAMYGRRFVRYDAAGRVIGADAVGDSGDYQWMVPTTDRTLLLGRLDPQAAPMPGRELRPNERIYRVFAMSENCKVLDEVEVAVERKELRSVQAIDGWLLLSTRSDTMALPLPVEP